MNQTDNSQDSLADLRQVKGPRTKVRMPNGKERIPLGTGVITDFLGEGGMANVYEIWNSQLEVEHAVKLINPNCSDDAKERFKTEIKICAKLHHPNIIEIYGVGKWNDLPYIEMEKIDGLTLDKKIRRRGALPPHVCTAVGIMIGRALKYAHNQEYKIYGNTYHGIIHRDIKPGNIMLNKNGVVKLMDFGIASPTEASFHTMEGTVLGTLQYLSPEQLEGKKLDIKTDIYSLGVTMYEIVCGHLAFPERNVHKLMMDKLKGRFKPLEEYDIKMPARLRRLIYRAMQHDRKARISNAETLLSELDKVHQSLTADTPEKIMSDFMANEDGEKIIVKTRRRLPRRFVAAAVIALGLGLAAQYAYNHVLPKLKTMLLSRRDAPASTAVPVAPAPAPVAVQTVPDVQMSTKLSSVRSQPRATSGKGRGQSSPSVSAAPPKPLSLVNQLAEKHGTTEPIELMARELRDGGFSNVSRLYALLGPDLQKAPKAQILYLRALQKMGNAAKLGRALAAHVVDDGEYWLMKAKLSYAGGNVVESQKLLDRSEATKREFLDYAEFKQEVLYYRALCATRIFDSGPSEEHYKVAIEKWYELRNSLRDNPNNRYHKIILAETQRVGQVFRTSRGEM